MTATLFFSNIFVSPICQLRTPNFGCSNLMTFDEPCTGHFSFTLQIRALPPNAEMPRNKRGTGPHRAHAIHSGLVANRRTAPSFEQQRYRASGLKLVVAAIVLRNTV